MEEKIPSEFALPSPNFNKPQNGPNKTSMHYLTPCGMTLLPRSKQPPPMYGARGSTVPAKYLNEGKSPQPQKVAEVPPVYDSPPRPESCNNCNMELASSQDMKRHLQQHEICPAEDCDFSALSGILERHIESNHITGLYQKVKKVWTPEDIAAWRAERRKRFPTTANVELAKRAKEQRMKRGERLEASKSRFGQAEDRKRTRTPRTPAQTQANKRKPKQNAFKSKQQHKKTKIENHNPIKLEEEEKDSPALPVERFRGTSQMLDYKHVKDKKSVGNNVLTNLLGMYGSDSDEDEEDDANEPGAKDQSPLPPLDDTDLDRSANEEETVSASSMLLTDEKVLEVKEIAVAEVKEQSSPPPPDNDDDEAPDEIPIERLLTADDNDQSVLEKSLTVQDSKPKSSSSSGKPSVKQVVLPHKKRQCGLNYKRAKQLYRHSTMLSKLLASDIRHERNVLLQCVRYVCEKDFFGIGGDSQRDVVADNVDLS